MHELFEGCLIENFTDEEIINELKERGYRVDNMKPFTNKSSFLEGCTYDKDICCLTVHFKNGKEYKYTDVDFQAYDDFLNAPSPGQYFGDVIKKQFKPFVEVVKK